MNALQIIKKKIEKKRFSPSSERNVLIFDLGADRFHNRLVEYFVDNGFVRKYKRDLHSSARRLRMQWEGLQGSLSASIRGNREIDALYDGTY